MAEGSLMGEVLYRSLRQGGEVPVLVFDGGEETAFAHGVFEFMQLLPVDLWVYSSATNVRVEMMPAIKFIGGKAWLVYEGDGYAWVLSERLGSEAELIEHIAMWAERLKGETEYQTDSKFFTRID